MEDEEIKAVAETGIALAVETYAIKHGVDAETARGLGKLGSSGIVRVVLPRIARAYDAVKTHVVRVFGAEKAEQIENSDNGAATMELIFDSLLRSPDPAAVPFLLAVGDEYIAAGKRPDGRLRETAEMFVRCEASDILALQNIARRIDLFDEDKQGAVILKPTGDFVQINSFQRAPGREETPKAPRAKRVMRLLERAELIEEIEQRSAKDGAPEPPRMPLSYFATIENLMFLGKILVNGAKAAGQPAK